MGRAAAGRDHMWEQLNFRLKDFPTAVFSSVSCAKRKEEKKRNETKRKTENETNSENRKNAKMREMFVYFGVHKPTDCQGIVLAYTQTTSSLPPLQARPAIASLSPALQSGVAVNPVRRSQGSPEKRAKGKNFERTFRSYIKSIMSPLSHSPSPLSAPLGSTSIWTFVVCPKNVCTRYEGFHLICSLCHFSGFAACYTCLLYLLPVTLLPGQVDVVVADAAAAAAVVTRLVADSDGWGPTPFRRQMKNQH